MVSPHRSASISHIPTVTTSATRPTPSTSSRAPVMVDEEPVNAFLAQPADLNPEARPITRRRVTKRGREAPEPQYAEDGDKKGKTVHAPQPDLAAPIGSPARTSSPALPRSPADPLIEFTRRRLDIRGFCHLPTAEFDREYGARRQEVERRAKLATPESRAALLEAIGHLVASVDAAEPMQLRQIKLYKDSMVNVTHSMSVQERAEAIQRIKNPPDSLIAEDWKMREGQIGQLSALYFWMSPADRQKELALFRRRDAIPAEGSPTLPLALLRLGGQFQAFCEAHPRPQISQALSALRSESAPSDLSAADFAREQRLRTLMTQVALSYLGSQDCMEHLTQAMTMTPALCQLPDSQWKLAQRFRANELSVYASLIAKSPEFPLTTVQQLLNPGALTGLSGKDLERSLALREAFTKYLFQNLPADKCDRALAMARDPVRLMSYEGDKLTGAIELSALFFRSYFNAQPSPETKSLVASGVSMEAWLEKEKLLMRVTRLGQAIEREVRPHLVSESSRDQATAPDAQDRTST